MGAIVLVTGILQSVLKKGGKTHILIGKVYLLAWLLILLTGAYVGGPFMITIGVFGFYFALTGSRIGRLKGKAHTGIDKAIIVISSLISLYMIYFAATLFMRGDRSFATIFLVFGLIFLFTTVGDTAKYILLKPIRKRKHGKSDWYFEHLRRMFISLIAAVTAFTSIQNIFNHNTLNFLLPTVIGLVMIKYATTTFEKKLQS